MATPFSYTVPNWREGSPNAAEQGIYTELMRDPSKNSGMGLLLGNQLAADRHIQERNYMDELAQQHAFAQRALDQHTQAQQREDLMKLLERGEKNAGTLGLANNNPILAPLLAGTDVDMMGQHAQFTKQATDAEAYEKTGKGYREFREGGGYTPPGVIANMLAPAGVQIQDTTPTAILAAQARGIADATPQGTMTSPPLPNYGGAQFGVRAKQLPGESNEDFQRRLGGATSRHPTGTNPVVAPIPQRSPVSDTLPQAPGSTQSQQTEPPPAPMPAIGGGAQASPASPLPSGSPPVPPPGQATAPVTSGVNATRATMDPAPSGTPGKVEAQRAARDILPRLAAARPDVYRSIIGRMSDPGPEGTGGDIPVALLPGSGWVMLGKGGQIFEIPGYTKSLTTDRSGRNGVMK